VTTQREGHRDVSLGARRSEWLRYAGVGVCNTVCYDVIFRALHQFTPYLVAHAMAFAVCIVISFFLNCAFTFHVSPTWRRFIRFPLSTLTTFIILTVGVSVLVEGVGTDPNVASLVSALAAVPLSYVASRLLLVGHLRH
jgi:putative flippase GtrA